MIASHKMPKLARHPVEAELVSEVTCPFCNGTEKPIREPEQPAASSTGSARRQPAGQHAHVADGSRWSAIEFTLPRSNASWRGGPEAARQGAVAFWCSDGLIVRDPGIDNVTQALAGFLEDGDFTQVLQRLDDD